MDIHGTSTKGRLLPYLFCSYRPFLIMVLHSTLTALFFRSYMGFALLLPWLLSLIALQKPSIPTSARHEDVAEFMNTDIGQILTRRRCWIPKDEKGWVIPLVGVLLLLPGAAIGLLKSGADQMNLQAVSYIFKCAWAGIPLVITAAFIMENILHIPVVYGPLILFYIVFFVTFIVQEEEKYIIRFAIAIPAVIVPLYTLDLLRLLRRAWYSSEH